MNSNIRITFLLAAIFLAFIIYACDDTFVQSDIDNKIIPETNVSYSEHIHPLLNAKCAFSGCHEDQTRAAGLSVTSYGNTIADPQMVFPYFPQNSKLVWAVEGSGPSWMPPLIYPQLTQNQIDGIKQWIAEGAQPN